MIRVFVCVCCVCAVQSGGSSFITYQNALGEIHSHGILVWKMSLKNSKSGFSVRDILDLPDTSDEGSVTEDTEDEADEGFSGNQQRASSTDALWLGSPCGHKYPCKFTCFNDLNKYLKLVLCYFNIFK